MRYFALVLLLALVASACLVDAPPSSQPWPRAQAAAGPGDQLHHLFPGVAR